MYSFQFISVLRKLLGSLLLLNISGNASRLSFII